MWFRRADADQLRDKARRFRSMAIDDDDTPVSGKLLHIAAALEARAAAIDDGQDMADPPSFAGVNATPSTGAP